MRYPRDGSTRRREETSVSSYRALATASPGVEPSIQRASPPASRQVGEKRACEGGRGVWRRSRLKRRPWPRRRSRRSSSSSTSPSRSRSNLHSPPLPLPSAYANAVVQVHAVLILNQHLLRLQNSVLQNSLTCF